LFPTAPIGCLNASDPMTLQQQGKPDCADAQAN
jgi:hypothetical protein